MSFTRRERRTAAPPTSDPSQSRRQRALIVGVVCCFLIVAVALVFGQTIEHEFINFDDNVYVYENPQVLAGLTFPGLRYAFTSGPGGEWYPLTMLSHMLDVQLFGSGPAGHHLTNVLLHGASTIALFLAFMRMTGDWRPSALVAALFGIHPLHVESVAWVAERRDVLSGLFFMLTLLAYAGYVRRPSLARYLSMLVAFALGLLSKPMLVTLPVLLLLLDYWPLRRVETIRRLILEKLPMLALALAAAAITVLTHPTGDASLDKVAQLSLSARGANAVVAYAEYLRQFVYPAGLAPYYPHPGADLPLWNVAIAVLVLAAITAVAVLRRAKQPYLLVGWLWYVSMLAPVSGLIQVGTHAMADRYTYLSQIGIYVAIAWTLSAVKLPSRRLVDLAGAAAVALLIVVAWKQTSLWRDGETLWAHTVASTPENAHAYFLLGLAQGDNGKADEAVASYRRAVALDPDHVKAHDALGILLALRGNTDEAIAHFQHAVRRDASPATLNNLANALARAGRGDEAIPYYEQALKLDPHIATAHFGLGLAIFPKGRTAEAIGHWREAVRLEPGGLMALAGTAWTMATHPDASSRNGAEAVALAELANELSGGGEPALLDVLGAAYAEAGQFTRAEEVAQRALTLAAQRNDSAQAAAVRERLELYRARTPYRSGPRINQ